MVYQIELSDEAKVNINEASEYYLKISKALHDKFIADVVKTIDGLQDKPLHFQIRYRSIRIAHTNVFPFGVHFIIESATIRILKILHHKQYYK
ncbi:type II toxin-antitoxin system RelE/ParE family toxin [Seonamhaeicola sp. ML3]|uniref:type II toxin-antitoxin system RelE/ParE family toxin n=1 Tax=Seonamhaeicola sp. ML3 TaxID=2937786 RepID=UPI00200E93D4|nr:type II toxin-antitoxin system RelE/ParE family toxin [Seonamhaeicola sp. ML3]